MGYHQMPEQMSSSSLPVSAPIHAPPRIAAGDTVFRTPTFARKLPSSLFPVADIQDNVEEYVGGKDADIDGVIKKFQETSA
jgi:hypothetical protein